MLTGQLIGNYKILERLGHGGMGEVYKGIDITLERPVAIKLMRPELSSNEDLIKRFRLEAVALARLNHPNIVTLYNFSQFDDQFIMVLEFVDGVTLKTLIEDRGAIPWQQAILLVNQALSALEQAHHLKIIHRDIKPSNIMLTQRGLVKLMDFGIARILDTTRLTRANHFVGTVEYMAPECIKGQPIDARTDIYSLGVVLYEMLTGHPPFGKSSDLKEAIRLQLEQAPQPPHLLVPQLPPLLEKAVLCALAKAPEDRFQSATAFQATLEKLLQTAPILPETRRGKIRIPKTRSANTLLAKAISKTSASQVRTRYRSIASLFRSGLSPTTYFKRYSGIVLLLILISTTAALFPTLTQSPKITPTGQPEKPAVPESVPPVSDENRAPTNPTPEPVPTAEQPQTSAPLEPPSSASQQEEQPAEPVTSEYPDSVEPTKQLLQTPPKAEEDDDGMMSAVPEKPTTGPEVEPPSSKKAAPSKRSSADKSRASKQDSSGTRNDRTSSGPSWGIRK